MAECALVTGGAGFIGLHLVRRLLADGARVTVLDDFSRGRRDPEFDELTRDVQVVPHDLTTPIPDNLLTADFDAVYHLAAMVGVQRTAAQPAKLLRTNILASMNVVDWCDRHRPGSLFLSSTSEIGDGGAALGVTPLPTPEDRPFVLADLHRPRSGYALSKAVSEFMALLSAQDRYRVRVARYYNVYGPRMGHSHVIPQFIGRVLDGVDPFPVYGAHQTRAFCHVDDAVEATYRVMRLPHAGPLVVNIGDDRHEIPMIDLARRLFALAGVDPEIAVEPAPAGSPDRRLPALDRLRSLVPDLPHTELDAGLSSMLQWYGAERARANR
ncbi:NAD-dependent epimerase/dehydratase family protein [Amycolatopsis sp. NBC_00345]|uniref:NAD-dependent epimerase/dehydratase family protein n=1 Tax=Amycolatopsis sp. NBC_00345 TaxID=2975955 RepID=UPI002E276BA4